MNPDPTPADKLAEYVAICFHSHYEALAPEFGYRTREESAVAWADVPEQNRRLMIATARYVIRDLMDRQAAAGFHIVKPGQAVTAEGVVWDLEWFCYAHGGFSLWRLRPVVGS